MAGENFTFVCGGDDFIVTRLGKALFESKKGDTEDEFSTEIISGVASNVSEVEIAVGRFRQAVHTLPLFGEKKTVWFKDVNFLGDSVTGRAEGTLAQVAMLQETLCEVEPESVALVISAFPVDRRRSFLKWCEENADFRLAGAGSDREISILPLIEEECRELGVNLGRDEREYLIAKLDGNSRLIIEELRKLATYLGDEGNTISEAHIAELVTDFGEGNFFEASEAFFSFDLEWTLAAIRRHFFSQRDARGLITSFQRRNRLLIQLRVLLDCGELGRGGGGISKANLDSAALVYERHFGEVRDKSSFNVFTQNPWYLGRLAKIASKLPLKRLIEFQREFLSAFEAILSRPDEQEEVMRSLAIRCLS